MTKMSLTFENQDWNNIRTSRGLALDILTKAGSGHPGATLSLTPVLYLLLQKLMAHDSNNSSWRERDRLVLSCGHASLALYIQLHLAGYQISRDDLFNFRQLGSITPGHPEYLLTPGVETTTGPLGQGFANAVGIALSQKIHVQKQKEEISLKRVYCVVSDGDLQEGISFEAANLAAIYKLNNLVVIYDSNDITIDGSTANNSVINTPEYFRSMGWQVSEVPKLKSGDIDVLTLAAQVLEGEDASCPQLIIVKSEIGWPSPKHKATPFIHGNILPQEEVSSIKNVLGFSDHEKICFSKEDFDYIRRENDKRRFSRLQNSTELKSFDSLDTQQLCNSVTGIQFKENVSTRKANGQILDELKSAYSWVIGGSADLTESNGLSLENLFHPENNSAKISNNLTFGVREHAMSAIANGLALDPENLIYCATYLAFSDYQKPAIRLSALMKLPITYIWTHDSIALGADGPTHQPIEHLSTLRAIPNFPVIRPGSAEELKFIWQRLIRDRKPAGLVLSRQDLPNRHPTMAEIQFTSRGAYRYFENFEGSEPDVVIIATGSELELATSVATHSTLSQFRIRVVSMPCQEWFLEESEEYRQSILPPACALNVSIEAACTYGWQRFNGANGINIGIDTFGASGQMNDLNEKFGFTTEQVTSRILNELKILKG